MDKKYATFSSITMPTWFNKNNVLLGLAILLMSFLLSRGVHQIYHQDEYRWIQIIPDSTIAGGDVHPPVNLTLLRVTARLFGYYELRVLPAFFAILNLILVYFVVKKLSGNKSVALLASFLFAFNTYSLIAGLQIDIDGAIMPFFVLASYNAYLRLNDNKRLWTPLFILSVIGGFLTKLSFLIFFGSLIVDYYFAHRHEHNFRLKNMLTLAGGGLVLFGLVGLAFYLLSPDKFLNVLAYAKGFKSFDLGSRAYLDLGFKVMKSFAFLSPLLFVPILYTALKADLRNRYRFWLIYLFFNFIFYTVLFDFSTLTIERYFMFMVAPAAIITAEVIYPFFKSLRERMTRIVLAGTIIATSALAALILSLYHVVLPLNPKIAYFQHFKAFDLRFLIPFTGGSGPIGFYFSALFIFVFWLLTFVAFVGYWLGRKPWASACLVVIVVLGFIYNALFITEFLWGKFYGSVPNIARASVSYVNSNPDITQVITYYDIAPYDLRDSGKYYSRFYTSPKRDYTPKITNFRGHYMIVDFPAIDKDSLYWRLIERCALIKEFQDKQIHSYIFDCRSVPSSTPTPIPKTRVRVMH